MPEGLLAVCVVVGALAGAVFGFVRGLWHPPTLPFAVVEGTILFAVPAALLGAMLVGAWWLGRAIRRHGS